MGDDADVLMDDGKGDGQFDSKAGRIDHKHDTRSKARRRRSLLLLGDHPLLANNLDKRIKKVCGGPSLDLICVLPWR